VSFTFLTPPAEGCGEWSLGAARADRHGNRSGASPCVRACGNEKLSVLDSDDGHVVATPGDRRDPDGAVFDAKTQRIFTSKRKARQCAPGGFRRSLPDPADTDDSPASHPAMDENTGRIYLRPRVPGLLPAGGGAAPICRRLSRSSWWVRSAARCRKLRLAQK